MTQLIEDYALIGNCETVALVSRGGSMNWLGLPRFGSPAGFAPLMGSPENGRWLIAPADSSARSKRRCRGGTVVLETMLETGTDAVRIVDFMARRSPTARTSLTAAC